MALRLEHPGYLYSCDCDSVLGTDGTLGSVGTLRCLDLCLSLHVVPDLLPSKWLFYLVLSHSLAWKPDFSIGGSDLPKSQKVEGVRSP